MLTRLGLPDWPYLPAPTELGLVTVSDLQGAHDLEQYADGLQQWTSSTWAAWAAHHDTVRGWTAAAVGRLG